MVLTLLLWLREEGEPIRKSKHIYGSTTFQSSRLCVLQGCCWSSSYLQHQQQTAEFSEHWSTVGHEHCDVLLLGGHWLLYSDCNLI
ncbi:hypothetical protein HA466_0014020 [Hirschfeldia incana]|nr:hypothetical protein HA466_0014020 [Hirschfeldia incana]